MHPFLDTELVKQLDFDNSDNHRWLWKKRTMNGTVTERIPKLGMDQITLDQLNKLNGKHPEILLPNTTEAIEVIVDNEKYWFSEIFFDKAA